MINFIDNVIQTYKVDSQIVLNALKLLTLLSLEK